MRWEEVGGVGCCRSWGRGCGVVELLLALKGGFECADVLVVGFKLGA